MAVTLLVAMYFVLVMRARRCKSNFISFVVRFLPGSWAGLKERERSIKSLMGFSRASAYRFNLAVIGTVGRSDFLVSMFICPSTRYSHRAYKAQRDKFFHP